MELPHLGKQCCVDRCLSKNDYLIMKCVFCKKQFCNTHSKPRESQHLADQQGGHDCIRFPIDARTVICPVCEQIVPVAKGQEPDVVVNRHINSGCALVSEKKVYTNQCGKKGCSKKELQPIQCKICLQNFCIKHRLESDHDCDGPPSSAAKAFWDFGASGNQRNSSGNGSARKKTPKQDCILQ